MSDIRDFFSALVGLGKIYVQRFLLRLPNWYYIYNIKRDMSWVIKAVDYKMSALIPFLENREWEIIHPSKNQTSIVYFCRSSSGDVFSFETENDIIKTLIIPGVDVVMRF